MIYCCLPSCNIYRFNLIVKSTVNEYCINMVKNDEYSLLDDLINQNTDSYHSPVVNFDKIDNEIIGLLLNGKNNKEISMKIRIPLSTVQRRVRNLIARKLVTFNSEINYPKFGFKVGMLHIYLEDGDFERIANK